MKKDEYAVMKKEFLEIQTGEQWNEFKERYPGIKFSEIDMDMKKHMNRLIKSMASQEEMDNPHIHYEIKKKPM